MIVVGQGVVEVIEPLLVAANAPVTSVLARQSRHNGATGLRSGSEGRFGTTSRERFLPPGVQNVASCVNAEDLEPPVGVARSTQAPEILRW